MMKNEYTRKINQGNEYIKKTNHGGHGVSRRKDDFSTKTSVLFSKTTLLRGFFLICTAAPAVISCEKRVVPTSLLTPPPEPEIQAVYAEPEITDVDAGEAEEAYEPVEEYVFPRRILVPYTKEYLSPGQETRITVLLENGVYGDEVHFEFTKEAGKNSIEVESVYNTAVIKAIREGEQYLCISHPMALEDRFIVYDVLPPSPPPPPEIDVSESPLIVRKDETRLLQLILRNSGTTAADKEKFQFQVVENAYAIEVRQHSDTLHITGIAPGAGKIRIQHPAALRDYDVMVIVD